MPEGFVRAARAISGASTGCVYGKYPEQTARKATLNSASTAKPRKTMERSDDVGSTGRGVRPTRMGIQLSSEYACPGQANLQGFQVDEDSFRRNMSV